MYYSTEEAEFMAQLFVNSSSSSSSSSTFRPGYEYSTANMPENIDHSHANVHSSGHGSRSSTFFPISSHDQFLEMKTNQNTASQQVDQVPWGSEVSMNFLNEEEMSCRSVEESGWNVPKVVLVHGQNLQPIGRQSEMAPLETSVEDKNDNFLSENTMKRFGESGDYVRRKKNVKSKKNQKINNGENNTAGLNTQKSTSSCSLEDESSASQELNEGVTSSSSSKGASALNSIGKARASRGSATDPQSLYARRRRERINESLRILQSLVPNGTKVDISTMLEEAVQYVKFLQLQIKLLSSDELWMYAPIAYNGMDIGLI